jgi:hypothetical protein
MILIPSEDDIAASRKGVRSHCARGCIRGPISMDSDTAEVHTKARLEERSLLVRQRLPTANCINLRFGLD